MKTKVIVEIMLALFLVNMLSTVMPVSATSDINKDGVVDIEDISIVIAAFGSNNKTGTPTPRWNPDADVYSDKLIDIFDLVSVAVHFGEYDC